MLKSIAVLVGAGFLIIALLAFMAVVLMSGWNMLAPAFKLPTLDIWNAFGAIVILVLVRQTFVGSRPSVIQPVSAPSMFNTKERVEALAALSALAAANTKANEKKN